MVCIPSGCMFALRLCDIGMLCSGTVALPGYFVYCYTIYTYMYLADSHKLKITFHFYINIFKTSVLVGPRHAKVCRRVHVCADSEGPDQTAHTRSLIKAFAVRKQNHWIL